MARSSRSAEVVLLVVHDHADPGKVHMSCTFARARYTLAVVTLLSTASCTSTRVTRFEPTIVSERRTPPESIRFYEGQKPECEYKEIGHVTSSGGWFTSWGRVIKAARKKASELGGDAILSFKESTRITGAVVNNGQISTEETSSLSGTVIRFRNSGCRQ